MQLSTIVQPPAPARDAARLRTLDRILSQWTTEDFAALSSSDRDGITLLRQLRRQAVDRLRAASSAPSQGARCHYPEGDA
jgi:hypothetical protein